MYASNVSERNVNIQQKPRPEPIHVVLLYPEQAAGARLLFQLLYIVDEYFFS